MNHWALRCEASHRSGCLARLGYLPTHFPALAVSNARSSSKPLAHQLLIGRFDPDRTFPPPHDPDSVVALTRTQLLESLETDPHFTRLGNVAKKTIQRLVVDGADDMADILCDLFWASMISMYLKAGDDAVKPGGHSGGSTLASSSFLFDAHQAHVGPRSSSTQGPVEVAEATWREIEEVFAAACPPNEDALDVPSVVHLFAKMQLTVSERTLPELMGTIRGDKVDVEHQARKPQRRMSSGAAIRQRTLSSVGQRGNGPSTAADGLQASMSSMDLTATAAKSLSFTTPALSNQVTKHHFMRWCFVVRLCDAEKEHLRRDVHRYVERAAKRFHRRISPFEFALSVRDTVELPLCLVMAKLLTQWVRASVALPTDDGPRDITSAEHDALLPVVEALVSQWLVGLPITRVPSVQPPPSKHPAQPSSRPRSGRALQLAARSKDGGNQPSGLSPAPRNAVPHNGTVRSPQAPSVGPPPASMPTPPRSHLHDTTPSAVDASPPSDFVAATAAAMHRAMFLLSKAARFGGPADAPQPPVSGATAVSGPQGTEGTPDAGGSPKAGHRRGVLLVEQNASAYHSLQTLLRITDEEVSKECSRGGEANIHRAATYIAAQQRLVDEAHGRRGEGAATAGGAAAGATIYLPLDEMLRDESRPDCVRHAALQSQRGALTAFSHHGAAPLGPLDRLSVVQRQSGTTAEAMEQPFTARRRTAPVGDIASATSQRSIAKHALRLSQQLEGERGMHERTLERVGLQLAREYNDVCLGTRQVNQNADDAELYRMELKRIHEAFDEVLQHASFLFLKADTRLAILKSATHVGKAYRGVCRRSGRHRTVTPTSTASTPSGDRSVVHDQLPRTDSDFSGAGQ